MPVSTGSRFALVSSAALLAACGDAEGGGGGSGGASSSAQTTTASSGSTTASGSGSPTGSASTSSGEGGSVSTSSATTSSGTGGGGGAPSGLVPIFLAQGHLGRTTISCDDGRTWIRDQSVDDGARCFEGDLDCDHHPFAGRGIAYGDDAFVLTWGWGAPGEIHRSTDALTWAPVLTETATFADLAFGNGRFVANGWTTMVSDDAGSTWTEGAPLGLGINTRSIDFAPGAGRFVVTAESGDLREILHSPDGVTWTAAAQRPAECLAWYRGMAEGNGTLVAASGQGHVCTSSDGGDTWAVVDLGDSLSSPVVWTGTEFLVYAGSTAHRSPDGASWSTTEGTPGVSIGALAMSPDGTFVASNDGWMSWYEEQAFYRSEDGLTWETLAPGTFTGSHPIYFMAFGWVEPTEGCGAPSGG